jgi:Putative Ig domain
MPDGNVGTFYGNFITSSGGQGTPHTFRLIAGRMPAGLTMATDFGVQSTSVTGTPTTVETQTFTVQVRDGSGNTASKVLSITIDPPRPLVITNQGSTLASGTRGSAYAASLFADGGVRPYTWAIVAGQLPPGLNLSGNRIQGTPTAAGTFTFTARVRDSGGQEASRQFSITVS